MQTSLELKELLPRKPQRRALSSKYFFPRLIWSIALACAGGLSWKTGAANRNLETKLLSAVLNAGDRQGCTSPVGEEKISGDDARENKICDAGGVALVALTIAASTHAVPPSGIAAMPAKALTEPPGAVPAAGRFCQFSQ